MGPTVGSFFIESLNMPLDYKTYVDIINNSMLSNLLFLVFYATVFVRGV